MKIGILFATALLVSQVASTQNLIVNPSAESPPATVGWTVVAQGSDCNGTSNWRVGSEFSTYPASQAGNFYFYPGCNSDGELIQDIDVSDQSADIDAGAGQFVFSGYTRSFDQAPVDEARIVVEYRDAGGSVLGAYDTGETTNTLGWVNNSDTRNAPVGTRTIRIRLLSTLNSGSSNDAYFDDLSLTMTTVVMPVELLSFTAAITPSSQVELRWETATETDNDYFLLERSFTGNDWTKLTTVAGAGTTTEQQKYRYLDPSPGTESVYYRITQVDYDGSSTYFPIRRVGLGSSPDAATTVFPNPTAGAITLRGTGVGTGPISIFNTVMQRIVRTPRIIESSPDRVIVDLADCPSGVYYVMTGSGTLRVLRK